MSSLTQLKNSLATAFAPILNVVAPILNSFIQTVINVGIIGQLMGSPHRQNHHGHGQESQSGLCCKSEQYLNGSEE